MLAGAGNISPVHNVLMAETMTCVKAVEAIQAHGISRIQVETNSSQLREALQSNVLDLEPSGILFMFLRKFLDVHFDRYIVSNVPWSCNVCPRDCQTWSNLEVRPVEGMA